MNIRNLLSIGTIAAIAGAGSAFGQATMIMPGVGINDLSIDGDVAVGQIYNAAIDEYEMYKYVRGTGAVLLPGGYWEDGTVTTNFDGTVLSTGMFNLENIGGFGTNRTIAHRWNGTVWQNIGILPGGNRCDFNINTANDTSGDGRYTVGGGWTQTLCGSFRAWRFDSQSSAFTQLPHTTARPPFFTPSRATRADSVSNDGTVICGYDDNYFQSSNNQGRRAAVWEFLNGNWVETVLDLDGGEANAVSGTGTVIVGRMSTTTMQATFGTTILTPVIWNKVGNSWVPQNLGGDPNMRAFLVSFDGSTVAGSYGGQGFIYRASINGGVPMSLADYFVQRGGSFPGITFGSPAGAEIRSMSGDGNTFWMACIDDRNPCLSTYTNGIVYTEGAPCEPARINFSPISQDITGPSSGFGIISNCFASGTWPLNYQWQKETSPGVWTDLTDDNCFEFSHPNFDVKGSISSQLRLGTLSNMWQGNYRCVVTNSCGSATSAVAHIGPVPPCPADLNGDNVVDISDLTGLLSNFGIGGATPEQGDLDGDGDVDLTDLAMMLSSFGLPCP